METQDNLKGILWMMAAGLLFVAVTVLVRHLGSSLPAVQAAFIRYSIGLAMLVPLMFRMHWRSVRGAKLGIYTLRGLAHGAAVMLWFYAMARIPIAEVTAIGYTTPIFTAVGAILIFGERIHVRRMLAIAAGFLGTLIILRPGFQSISLGSLAQLTAAPCFAISFLFAKQLTRTENSTDILVMLSIGCTLTLLPGAVLNWHPPTLAEYFYLFLVAIFATAGHYALTRSFSRAPLTVTQPYSFLQLVWAMLFGYLLFSEVPDIWVVAGGAVIVSAISYLTHREAVARRKARAKDTDSTTNMAN